MFTLLAIMRKRNKERGAAITSIFYTRFTVSIP